MSTDLLRSSTRTEQAILGGCALWMVIVGWAMMNLRFDIWGALIVAPVLFVASVPLVRHLFRGLDPRMVPWAIAGLAAHMVGSVARYWVAFDAYGGSADAGHYHEVGSQLAGVVRSDLLSFGQVVPTPTGTVFIEKLTGLLYTVTGPSKMLGFLVFGWFAFIGLCLFIRAASIGIPELSQRRYAVAVLFLPSLVYWPSSIGKESWMIFSLGVASDGLARLFTLRQWTSSLALTAAGLAGAACVRPHVAAMWGVAAVFAIVGSFLVRTTNGGETRVGVVAAATLLIALGATLMIGRIAIDYLDNGENSSGQVTDRISNILRDVENRTSVGGSGFTPPSVDGPQDWPFAIVRTLTRPMLVEANSLSSLLPALEMTALLVIAVFSLDRLAALPTVMLRRPYLLFALATLAVFGLAFASVGNLGILARQRSLILPFLVLPVCVVPLSTLRRRDERRRAGVGRRAPLVVSR